MTAAVLTVGTEITSGEILNRNSSWISDRLEKFGVEVLIHMSAPDDHDLILYALNSLKTKVDLILVTGGLGPTTDDFTREVIADFVQQPLVFNQKIFDDLKRLYTQRGLPLREAHRQQCYFPETAQILNNPVGTAHGFLLQNQSLTLAVLPGPPREVEGVFDLDFAQYLLTLKIEKQNQLTVFKCLGVPESEVAEIVEKELAGKGLILGYRASHPYVYVKIWAPPNQTFFVERLKSLLKSWLIEIDLAEAFLKLAPPSAVILDQASGGHLMLRLQPFLKLRPDISILFSKNHFESQFVLEQHSDSFVVKAPNLVETILLPYKMVADSDRGRIFMVEHALKIFVNGL